MAALALAQGCWTPPLWTTPAGRGRPELYFTASGPPHGQHAAPGGVEAGGRTGEPGHERPGGQVSQAEHTFPRLLKKLVPYQRRGTGWLLSSTKPDGGILADEMGRAKPSGHRRPLRRPQNGRQKAPHLLGVPLAGGLSALTKVWWCGSSAASGERRQAVESAKADEVDVILTSYPCCAGTSICSGHPLRFAIWTRQFVKNAEPGGRRRQGSPPRCGGSQAPPWKTTGELWSIFDFVLPGTWAPRPSCGATAAGSGWRSSRADDHGAPPEKEVLADLPQKNSRACTPP